MMDPHTLKLEDLARIAMREHDLLTNFSKEIELELEQISHPGTCASSKALHDLREKIWFSIDNEDSKDLDQITYAEKLPNQSFKIYVAIADVTCLVKKGSAIDQHAQHNTTTVYTPSKNFSMLPEKLSTNLTSLNLNEERLAIVTEICINEEGALGHFNLYRALVKNYAKLDYNKVNAWLENHSVEIPSLPGLAEQIKLQDQIAQHMKKNRHTEGMLSLQTIETKAIISEDKIVDLVEIKSNRARELIEHFMIAANIATTRYLLQKKLPVLRRIVRTPKRWERIVEIAAQKGSKLPSIPDSKALELFLLKQKKQDPIHFPDLSLTIIKLLGRGEYAIQFPDQKPLIHFGLATKEYSHTTAPNRRYPDIIIQRLIKAALGDHEMLYSHEELESLARHCSLKEVDAEKVERRMKKSAAALFLSSYVGKTFEGIITGSNEKGTWVRIVSPPAEGKLVSGYQGVDVGDKIKVELVNTDVLNGYIDFKKRV
jgi:VacB/RNase II family 3'-5' exoribonuclease